MINLQPCIIQSAQDRDITLLTRHAYCFPYNKVNFINDKKESAKPHCENNNASTVI